MNRLKDFTNIFPRILKFQILTHLLFIFIILPSYFYIRTFLVSLNRLSVIDNTELMRFVFSPLGIVLLVVSLIVIFFYFLIHIDIAEKVGTGCFCKPPHSKRSIGCRRPPTVHSKRKLKYLPVFNGIYTAPIMTGSCRVVV